jgi:hypothetical protein
MVNYEDLSLKTSLSLLILVICYKLYRMKIHTLSHCCKDAVEIETENTSERELNSV